MRHSSPNVKIRMATNGSAELAHEFGPSHAWVAVPTQQTRQVVTEVRRVGWVRTHHPASNSTSTLAVTTTSSGWKDESAVPAPVRYTADAGEPFDPIDPATGNRDLRPQARFGSSCVPRICGFPYTTRSRSHHPFETGTGDWLRKAKQFTYLSPNRRTPAPCGLGQASGCGWVGVELLVSFS